MLRHHLTYRNKVIRAALEKKNQDVLWNWISQTDSSFLNALAQQSKWGSEQNMELIFTQLLLQRDLKKAKITVGWA